MGCKYRFDETIRIPVIAESYEGLQYRERRMIPRIDCLKYKPDEMEGNEWLRVKMPLLELQIRRQRIWEQLGRCRVR